MKIKILTIIAFVSCNMLFAQTEVNFQINHKLGDSDFAFNTETENDLGEAFDVTRIEYYISDVVIYHDNGLVTDVEDLWILANGNATTNVLLGDFDITQVDSLSFYIGVGPDVNHDDPSTYANGHPLGFHNPSMHWGWAAGYRFVAMEGNASSNLSDLFQIHALGDENYHMQTIVLSEVSNNNSILIELNADYEMALSGVSVDGGLINHSVSGEAAVLLENFRDLVFSPAGTQVGINELESISLQIYPNPVQANGQIYFKDNVSIDQVRLIDFSGRIVQDWNEVNGKIQLESTLPGTYLLSIYTTEGQVSTKKLIIQ